MIDLAIDPSETRASANATPQRSPGRRWARILLFGVLGLAGTVAFASVTSTYLSDLAGPRRAPAASRQRAADWPDLKDGLPALATGSLPTAVTAREIAAAAPTRPAVAEVRIEPVLRLDPAAPPEAVSAPNAPRITETKPDTARVARSLPAIVAVPVIGPARQASLVASVRIVTAIAPLAAETVRARTGDTAFAALTPEAPKIEAPKIDSGKPEAARTKPRVEPHAKPPAGDKAAARKPPLVEARAASVEASAEDEDTEVFGIKVPSLAPAGRKFRESVDALGDAVKGLPDRF